MGIWGIRVLSAWLIMVGIVQIFNVNLGQLHILLPIGAITAGVLLLIRR